MLLYVPTLLYKVFLDKKHSKPHQDTYLWQGFFKSTQALIFFWLPPPPLSPIFKICDWKLFIQQKEGRADTVMCLSELVTV